MSSCHELLLLLLLLWFGIWINLNYSKKKVWKQINWEEIIIPNERSSIISSMINSYIQYSVYTLFSRINMWNRSFPILLRRHIINIILKSFVASIENILWNWTLQNVFLFLRIQSSSSLSKIFYMNIEFRFRTDGNSDYAYLLS